MDDNRSRALLTTALHPSSTPNERLMALDALHRAMTRAGVHPGEITFGPPTRPPVDHGGIIRLEKENAALARRIKAQEAALRKADRAAADQAGLIATLREALTSAEAATDADACQIAALEADLATRDRMIERLRTANAGS